MEYVATLKKEGIHTVIEFPDCPGCQSFGDSKVDAIEQGREALEGWLETHLQEGDVPPRPRARAGVGVRIAPLLALKLELRWARDAAGLTQTELAKRVGISQQMVAKLEHPDYALGIEVADRVAHELGMELSVHLSEHPLKLTVHKVKGGPPKTANRSMPRARAQHHAGRAI